MGPGLFGVALAAKPQAPKAPLWSLLIASEALDLLCRLFFQLGIEKAGASRTILEQGVKILDFITHLPDLPLLFSDSPRLGLGLWGSGAGLVISGVPEILLLAGGIIIYLRWRGIFGRKMLLPKEVSL
jgi:hypothetical protein